MGGGALSGAVRGELNRDLCVRVGGGELAVLDGGGCSREDRVHGGAGDGAHFLAEELLQGVL